MSAAIENATYNSSKNPQVFPAIIEQMKPYALREEPS